MAVHEVIDYVGDLDVVGEERRELEKEDRLEECLAGCEERRFAGGGKIIVSGGVETLEGGHLDAELAGGVVGHPALRAWTEESFEDCAGRRALREDDAAGSFVPVIVAEPLVKVIGSLDEDRKLRHDWYR